MSTDGKDFQVAIEDFKRGGWVVSVLGAAGMVARMLLTDTDSPWVTWFRRCTAGAIVGVLAFFATHGTDIPQIYKSIICSLAGAAAPELIEEVRRRLTKEASNAVTNKADSRRRRK